MVQFNFTYDLGVSVEQRIGFELAAIIWSSYLTDDVTINLHIGSSASLGEDGNAVGGAVPIFHEQNYGIYKEYLENDITESASGDGSSVDEQAYASLQTGNTVDLMIDGTVVNGNTNILLTSAQAKALGMADSLVLDSGGTWDRNLVDSTALDGYIVINQGFDWNYDFAREGTPEENTLDFLSMALHEIGHNLGFVSGIDGTMDVMKLHSGETRVDNFTALDLFRHTLASTATTNADGSVSDVSTGGNAYFSINGGQTNLADFSTGTHQYQGGDGYQASHWKRMRDALGIMDPTLAYKERVSLSTLDLQAMDALGWDVNYANAGVSLDLKTLLLQAEQAVSVDLGLASTTLTETRASNTTGSQQDIYQLSYSSWWQIFENQIFELGYSKWWQIFELGYSKWWQQFEEGSTVLELGYGAWWQNFEAQIGDMGYDAEFESLKGEMLELGYSKWWQLFELGYSKWWQKLETYFSKLEETGGIHSVSLQDTTKGIDLEAGTVANVGATNPALDLRFHINATGQVVLEKLNATASVVLLKNQDFAAIDNGILGAVNLSNTLNNLAFNYSDVILIKTADGNIFKLGRFSIAQGSGKVNFDYQYVATVSQTATGEVTTTVDAGMVSGGAKDDILAGQAGRDLIDGGKGDDLIDGKQGDDILLGDDGNDMIYGAEGNDVLYGGAGDDLLSGEADNDKLYGEAGHDILSGGAGNDILDGGAGRDVLKGDAGNDILDGGDDNDDLDGGAGRDVLVGNKGADVLSGGAGDDWLYGDRYGTAVANATDTSASTESNFVAIAQAAGIAYQTNTAFRSRIEAEDMRLVNYAGETQSFASGGELITTGGKGQARTTFNGPSGTYDITVCYYDENDGQASMNVKVGSATVDSWQLTQNLGHWQPNATTRVSRTIKDVKLNNGQVLELEGTANGEEYARFDYIDIVTAGAGGTAEGATSHTLVQPKTQVNTNIQRIEAESFTLNSGFQIEGNRNDYTSGDTVIRVASGSGVAQTTFKGESGKYNVFVGYLDENDGVASARIKINGAVQANWQFNNTVDAAEYKLAGSNVVLNYGDVIQLEGTANGSDQARIDYIDLLPVLALELDPESVSTAPAQSVAATQATFRVEAENMTLSGANYVVDSKTFASGGKMIRTEDTVNGTTASSKFTGLTGYYDVFVGYHDENDGNARFVASFGSSTLDSWQATANLGNKDASATTAVSRQVATRAFLTTGETFKVQAIRESGDKAYLDYVEFKPVAAPVSTPATSAANTTIQVEAENMQLGALANIVQASFAQGGAYVRSSTTTGRFVASTLFMGESGYYDVVAGYYDENDGNAQLTISHNQDVLDSWTLDKQLGNAEAGTQTFTTRTVASSVKLNTTDLFEIEGVGNSGDRAGFDYLKFIKVADPIATTPTTPTTPTTAPLGPNDDILRGGKGNDYLFGGEGNDTLYGEDEFDKGIADVDGSNDVLEGGAGDDVLYGNAGNDKLYGDSSVSVTPITTTTYTPKTVTFQQGLNGYTGTSDTTLSWYYSTSNYGNSTSLNIDNQSGANDNQGATHSLLRFDNIFGTQASQLSSTMVIDSAKLQLNVTNPGSSFRVFEMLQNWTESSTWSSMVNGIQTNGVEAAATPLITTGYVNTGILTIDVTASLKAWQANPTQNKGWAFLSTGTDGVDITSSEGTASIAPKLVIEAKQATTTTTTPTLPTISGNDRLVGGAGNDVLEGGLGSDILDGSDAIALGKGEQDILVGGDGADRFILGTAVKSYYLGGGANDYALIKDFNAAVDVLQLNGSAGSYQQQQQGTRLLLSQGQDLVAILENTTSPLNLTSPSVVFV
jgi:Ca2+-binding RTX toxin-like protein